MVFFMNIKVEPEWFDIVMTGLSNVPTDKDGRKIVNYPPPKGSGLPLNSSPD